MKDEDVEKEANYFALCLLMPRDMIMADLAKGVDLSSDKDMKRLCEKYQVSATALAVRISLLKLKS